MGNKKNYLLKGVVPMLFAAFGSSCFLEETSSLAFILLSFSNQLSLQKLVNTCSKLCLLVSKVRNNVGNIHIMILRKPHKRPKVYFTP